MATQQFANYPTTTLNGAITAGALSLVVNSTVGFPTQGNFQILIDQNEICQVTAVAGATWTITRAYEAIGGVQTAFAHSNNAPVVLVFTAGSITSALARIDQGNTFVGTQTFADGGTWSANGVFIKGGSPWYDVKAFGAKGDGVTDDASAFNNAITAASTANGVVVVPPSSSSYLITGAVSNPNNVSLLVLGQALFSGANALTTNIVRIGMTRTVYVSSTGSDNNPGTAASPFATLQHAVNVAKDMAGLGVGVTISVASGSYAGFVYSSNGLMFNATGINAAPAGIYISGGWGGGTTTITKCPTAPGSIVVYGGTVVLVGTITIQSTATGLFATGGGSIVINSAGVTFGACTNAHLHSELRGKMEIVSGYTISGNAPAHFESEFGGQIICDEVSNTITLTGSPVFSIAFAWIHDYGFLYVPSGSITFSGLAGATTLRYLVSGNSVISTNNGSATYLPGTTAGQILSGGKYLPSPAPTISALTGFGTGASAAVASGSGDEEGIVGITVGTTPGSAGSFTLTPGSVAPNTILSLWTLNPGTVGWNVRAVSQNGGSGAGAAYFTVDNNGVAFGAGTLYVVYRLTRI